MVPRPADTICRRLAFAAAIAHVAAAVAVVLSHPGLAWEPDRVANRLYFQGLGGGAARLVEQWYFPAPKILGVALASLGPTGEGMAAALAASLLAGCGTWLVARSAGGIAAVAFAVVLGLDPWWRVLVAIASADLFVAAGVAATAAAWEAVAPLAAALAVALVVLVKAPAAACVLPYLPDARRSTASRAGLAAAAAIALGGTFAVYGWLLGDASVQFRSVSAYARIRGGAPAVSSWLAGWVTRDLGASLGPAWPLAVAGVLAIATARGAGPMRRWTLACLAVAAAFVTLAAWTNTLLFARFLWVLEVALLALAAAGAAAVGRWIAKLVGASRASVESIAALACGALVACAPLFRGGGEPAAFEILFEHGARTALPWLERVGEDLPAGTRVVVPMWFQPAAMAILPTARVEAAEVLAARGVAPHPGEPGLLLLAPAFGEPAAATWLGEASRDGTVVETSDLPHMSLVRIGRGEARDEH